VGVWNPENRFPKRCLPGIEEANRVVIKARGGDFMKKLCAALIAIGILAGFLSAATISVIAPTSGDNWVKSQTYNIRWTSLGDVPATVKIQLRNAASTAVILEIVNSTPNNGSYSWTIPDSVAKGDYRIRVKAIGTETYGDSLVFSISPLIVITITQPAPQVRWIEGSTHSITWTKTGPMPNKVSIFLYHNDNRTTIASCVPNSGTYSWVVPTNIPVGKCQVEIMADTPQCQITDPHASSAFFWIALSLLPEAKAEKK
jgi:hypothetical protein